MTTRRILTSAAYAIAGLLAGCGPAVGGGGNDAETETETETVDSTADPSETGTSSECEGPEPSCPPYPGSCDDDHEVGICVGGEWECPFAQLPPGEEFRCSTGDPDTESSTSPTSADSSGSSTGEPPEGALVDVLFVVDNSANTAQMQRTLAQSAGAFLDGLEAAGVTDAHLMVTSTDTGNPTCSPFQPKGYDPLIGRPEASSCRERLDWFEPVSGGTSQAGACTDVCAEGSSIDGTFLTVQQGQSNASGTAAEALACLIPQGIRGCGYESPLEAMLQALNPAGCWNSPGGCTGSEDAFLRDDAPLLIVILTDEGDCSVADFSAMNESTYQAVNPDTGSPALSSAWCFNAGMDCDEGDTCVIRDDSPLQPIDRYAGVLSQLRSRGKQVEIALLAGLDPAETVRAWEVGDLFADEIDNGLSPADAQFQLGAAPSCKDEGRRVRALPTPRLQAALCGREPCQRSSPCEASYQDTLEELTHQL